MHGPCRGRMGNSRRVMVSPSVKSVPAKGDPPEGACSPHSGEVNEHWAPPFCLPLRASRVPARQQSRRGSAEDAGPELGHPAGARRALHRVKPSPRGRSESAARQPPRCSSHGSAGERRRRLRREAPPGGTGGAGSARTPPISRAGEPCGQSPGGSSSGVARGPCPAQGYRRRGRLADARGRAEPEGSRGGGAARRSPSRPCSAPAGAVRARGACAALRRAARDRL